MTAGLVRFEVENTGSVGRRNAISSEAVEQALGGDQTTYHHQTLAHSEHVESMSTVFEKAAEVLPACWLR